MLDFWAFFEDEGGFRNCGKEVENLNLPTPPQEAQAGWLG